MTQKTSFFDRQKMQSEIDDTTDAETNKKQLDQGERSDGFKIEMSLNNVSNFKENQRIIPNSENITQRNSNTSINLNE